MGLYLISLSVALIKAESRQKVRANSNLKEKIVFFDEFEPPGDDKPMATLCDRLFLFRQLATGFRRSVR